MAYVLDRLKEQGYIHVVLATGYLHEKVEEYFGNEYCGLAIDYARELTPLGTGGAIVNALKDGDKIQLIGFGSFEVKTTKARMGKNPATGAAIKIPASKRPAFAASKALKDAING